jgi:hypothetical protein
MSLNARQFWLFRYEFVSVTHADPPIGPEEHARALTEVPSGVP